MWCVRVGGLSGIIPPKFECATVILLSFVCDRGMCKLVGVDNPLHVYDVNSRTVAVLCSDPRESSINNSDSATH